MKKSIISILTIAVLVSASVSFTGCGGNEPVKETESDKPTAADMFTDNSPVFDAKAINPEAVVNSITIKAIGNTMADISYDQKTITVKSGTTIKINFINTSTDAAMPHNWVLVKDGTMEAVATAGISVGKEGSYVPNTNDVLIATRLLGPQEEAEITFPAPPAGKYQFVCTYPGHWSVMNGEFIVE